MTSEEMERVMEFIITQQANITTRLDSVTERLDTVAERLDTVTERLDNLTITVNDLAEAQARTEVQVEKLTRQVDTLAVRVSDLADAQGRTEQSIDTLAKAQAPLLLNSIPSWSRCNVISAKAATEIAEHRAGGRSRKAGECHVLSELRNASD